MAVVSMARSNNRIRSGVCRGDRGPADSVNGEGGEGYFFILFFLYFGWIGQVDGMFRARKTGIGHINNPIVRIQRKCLPRLPSASPLSRLPIICRQRHRTVSPILRRHIPRCKLRGKKSQYVYKYYDAAAVTCRSCFAYFSTFSPLGLEWRRPCIAHVYMRCLIKSFPF